MKPGSAAEAFTSRSNNTQESLQSTFQHPEGLQTARGLVHAVARHWFSRGGTDHTSPTITTFSDASPEVEGILSSILVFGDSQDQISHGGLLNAAGMAMSRDAMDLDAGDAGQCELPPPAANINVWTKSLIPSEAPVSYSARSDMLSRHANNRRAPVRNLPSSSTPSLPPENAQSLSGPRSFPLVSNSYRTFPEKSVESEIRSIFGARAVSNSFLQGTESPYRVESPAVQAATPTSLPPSTPQSQRENRHSLAGVALESAGRGSHFSVPDWDQEPIRRAQVIDPNASFYRGVHLSLSEWEGRTGAAAPPSLPTQSTSPNSLSRQSLVPTSHPYLLPYAGLVGSPHQPGTLVKVPPTIKKVLSVNKSVADDKDNASERQVHFQNKRALQQSDTTTIASTSPTNENKVTRQDTRQATTKEIRQATPQETRQETRQEPSQELPQEPPQEALQEPLVAPQVIQEPLQEPRQETQELRQEPAETEEPEKPREEPEEPREEPQEKAQEEPRQEPQQELQEPFFSTLQSPSPVATPQPPSSPSITDLSSPNLSDIELDLSEPQSRMPPRKRKLSADGTDNIDGATSKAKKQRVNEPSKKAMRKGAKGKELKNEPAKEKLPQAIIMRILEFTPPSFLSKARLISKSFKSMVDEFDSIFVNCRKENFGWDMPAPPQGLSERQYSDLFGGKGCLEPGCPDELCSRTHWSWAKRWCQDCWKSKIEREDRALKKYQGQYGRVTLTKLFECIPVGIHDSFLKPHDYIDNFESRSRQAPRLYKYYLASDIQQVINDYEALTPAPFLEDPTRTASDNAFARATHQNLMRQLDEKRNQFFTARKKENDDHMATVQKIETAIKEKREEDRKPNNENRDARKALFLRRAQEDLPHIPQDFIKEAKAFKAATRIFRDPGSERGWQTLKPKLEEAWEESQKKQQGPAPVAGLDGAAETDEAEVVVPDTPAPSLLQPQPQRPPGVQRPGFASHLAFDLGSITDLGASMSYRTSSLASHLHHPSAMYPGSGLNRNPSNMTYSIGFLTQAGFHNAATLRSYSNHPTQFQQLMTSHAANNYAQSPHNHHHHHNHNHHAQHGSLEARRDMSIQSVLSEPVRMHFNPNPDVGQP